MASGFRIVTLGCKSDKLKHVQSFRTSVLKVGSPDPRGSAARCQGVREELVVTT